MKRKQKSEILDLALIGMIALLGIVVWDRVLT